MRRPTLDPEKRKAKLEKRNSKLETRTPPTQAEVLLDVLKAARGYGAWMTVPELAGLTRYKSTSVSAQLRNLRKFHFGAHLIHKRVRADRTRTYEYQLGER